MNKTIIKNLIVIIAILIFGIIIIKMVPESRKTCRDFINRNDVDKYFNKNNAIWLDGDKDGIPCEAIINK